MTCSAWPRTSPIATVVPASSSGQAPAVKTSRESVGVMAALSVGDAGR
jgi:hypothetical protein